jgi:hypothetical protein
VEELKWLFASARIFLPSPVPAPQGGTPLDLDLIDSPCSSKLNNVYLIYCTLLSRENYAPQLLSDCIARLTVKYSSCQFVVVVWCSTIIYRTSCNYSCRDNVSYFPSIIDDNGISSQIGATQLSGRVVGFKKASKSILFFYNISYQIMVLLVLVPVVSSSIVYSILVLLVASRVP